MSKILQFKITLKGSNPKIWRRFQTEDNLMFRDLHYLIQAIMGWENDHLYQFIFEEDRYIGDPEMHEGDDISDDKETELSEIFNAPKTIIIYEYDFGDGWEHELVLENILEKNPEQHYPVCLAGELNCPPEDCGGIYGFYDMLNILKDEKHPDHEEIKEWMGEDYDPDLFDIERVNKFLSS
ncbi:MAG: plasmid pRiA4b ORF-3 family protein [Ignavibacteria bacterium]|nr:plasmid pRiA4b ORF-3 family protein [Ignavibacteria bacterium]